MAGRYAASVPVEDDVDITETANRTATLTLLANESTPCQASEENEEVAPRAPSLPQRHYSDFQQRGDDDLQCLEEKLKQVQREHPPAELRMKFYHATVVLDRSSLSDDAAAKVEKLKELLRTVVLFEDGRGNHADIGALDPTCSTPNDFLQYSANILGQFGLASDQSGTVFLCLSEADAQGGWIKCFADQSLVQPPNSAGKQATVILVFLDNSCSSNQYRHTSYTIDALLSVGRNLASLLEACIPRRREWHNIQKRRLAQWQQQRALNLLMEDREERYQQELKRQQVLESLEEQRRSHYPAASGSGAAMPFPSRTLWRAMSPSGPRPSPQLMPPSKDLVRSSCSQRPDKGFFEGDNWKKLANQPRYGIVLLYGLRGVGKTQLALRYSQHVQSKNEDNVYVYLFHFETDEAFAADVNLLGEQLDLGFTESSPSTLCDRFCSIVNALKSGPYSAVRKVLILDGAEADKFNRLLGKTSILESLLERRSDLLFLLTSTSRHHYETVHANAFTFIEVEPLSPEEVEQVMKSNNYFAKYKDLRSLAAMLRRELSGLPVGIFPALAFVSRTECTVEKYLKRFHDLEAQPSSYSYTFQQAIRLAIDELLERMRERSYAGATMVLLVACFARQELPTELLSRCLSLRARGQEEDGGCGWSVHDVVSELKAACLFENSAAQYRDIPLVTMHKVVHDVLRDVLGSDRAHGADALDLALRGAFLEVDLDTRHQLAREYAILLHPHVLKLTETALGQLHRLGDRLCAKLCLAYLLHATAYVYIEAGSLDLAQKASGQALGLLCELLGTSRDAMLGSVRFIEHGGSSEGSFAANCPLIDRLDSIAARADMAHLLLNRRRTVTAAAKCLPDHMTPAEYGNLVRSGSAINEQKLNALYPYELLSAVLYMHGRTLKRLNSNEAASAFRLCMHLCEHVARTHKVSLIYLALARRSGALTVAQEPGSDVRRAAMLHETIACYERLAEDDCPYFQMGLHKMTPKSDDLHQLLCSREIIKCLSELHRMTAGQSTAVEGSGDAAADLPVDDFGEAILRPQALDIQRKSFEHGRRMLLLAKKMDATLSGPCYIEYGHLTLQMLAQGGATHAVPYYGCGLEELMKANMPARAVLAAKEITKRHCDLGRVPSVELFDLLQQLLDRAGDAGNDNDVEDARASVDCLAAVHKLYQVLKRHTVGASQMLSKAFCSVAPLVLCRAGSTLDEELAYAWCDAARAVGYSEASIMKECRLMLQDQ